ncbi:MAG: 7-carboxy-7-deazaguanine synthase QueE [Fusobacterium sp.]|nr:7-carboxy-7-deazaguanine synthase QueE [Fusobacterium sp.]
MNKTYVKEFFVSIQGEGPYVGFKQLFIRFCKCNLTCKYCDTEFLASTGAKEYSAQELFDAVSALDLTGVHSISLTGGEPLLDTEFLKEFLPMARQLGKIYLETNATLPAQFEEIKGLVDIVSADIKLESAAGVRNCRHDEFFAACKGKDTYAKIVFDGSITDDEIAQTAALAKKHGLEIVLSPMMIGHKMSVGADFIAEVHDKYLKHYDRVRVIPQVHKFLGIE